MERTKEHPPDILSAAGFATAVKQIERLLFAACFSILGNGEACQDAVQTALLKAWENRGRLRDPAAFKSWMVRIAQNECRNYLRRKPNLPLDADVPYTEEDDAHLDVKATILALPQKQRLPAMLYYFERYSVREIALIMELPEGTVHSRLSRAREQLRKELPDYGN